MKLRNQAKLQQFESKAELLTAFESVNVTEKRSRPEREFKWRNKEQKDVRPHVKASKRKNTSSESSMSQPKIRCYNCSKFGHCLRTVKHRKKKEALVLSVVRKGM